LQIQKFKQVKKLILVFIISLFAISHITAQESNNAGTSTEDKQQVAAQQ